MAIIDQTKPIEMPFGVRRRRKTLNVLLLQTNLIVEKRLGRFWLHPKYVTLDLC
jgi:hypothetical protein